MGIVGRFPTNNAHFYWHITEKWLVNSSAERINIDITESLMNLVSSNFLCL